MFPHQGPELAYRFGMRRKENRVHRGSYGCKRCGLVITAGLNVVRIIQQEFSLKGKMRRISSEDRFVGNKDFMLPTDTSILDPDRGGVQLLEMGSPLPDYSEKSVREELNFMDGRVYNILDEKINLI